MIRATLDDLTHRLPCGIYQIGDGDGWASISDDPKTNLYPPFDSGE